MHCAVIIYEKFAPRKNVKSLFQKFVKIDLVVFSRCIYTLLFDKKRMTLTTFNQSANNNEVNQASKNADLGAKC